MSLFYTTIPLLDNASFLFLVCELGEIYYVTYVFGPRLPAHGRCISTKGELQRLNERKTQLSAYVIEVCPDCGWNHLVRIAPLGGK